MRQIKYPLYYIKIKIENVKDTRRKNIKTKKKVEEQFKDCNLTGKYLTRKIDDNTFINFADFILNNLENAEYNISKIRNSLVILKDGQAVFTNLEKVYIYRYIFAKGKVSEEKIQIKDINKIPEKDIVKYAKRMIEDHKKGSQYEFNSLRQDKLLWIAREYQNKVLNM